MRKLLPSLLLILALLPCLGQGQVLSKVGRYVVPNDLLIKIVKAEDARDAQPVIEMLADGNPATRYRSALAAGRIGDEKAIDGLTKLLTDDVGDVRIMAMFAIGEIESARGADAVLYVLSDGPSDVVLRARAAEAAGKIGAANPRSDKAKPLGEAILTTLRSEAEKGPNADITLAKLAITAALRTRPSGIEQVLARFLTHHNGRVRADAGNALGRLRAKNANAEFRSMLQRDPDVDARANAARALGVAEDREAYDLLADAAVNSEDVRVRISAIRSLAALREAKALEALLNHGNELIKRARRSRFAIPAEKTELLEIATAVSRLVPNSSNDKAVDFLQALRALDGYRSGETEVALATVAPSGYVAEFNVPNSGYADWRVADAYAQGLNSLAASTDVKLKQRATESITKLIVGMATGVKPGYQKEMLKALPALHRANAAFKPYNLNETLRGLLTNEDVNVRSAAASLIGAQPADAENIEALKRAFANSQLIDKTSDDTQLAIIGALNRLNKKESVGVLLAALDSPNFLVRKRAFTLLADPELQKAFPDISASLAAARSKKKDQVLQYSPASGTKMGQVLNSDADYRRAISRSNGSTKAVFRTSKGTFTISLNGGDAPLTVDNFIRLARSRYFNGAEVHRVVGNFVMQDGDPTGTGSGGPGWSIRCEINMTEFERGTVGMALSGKDTGGSQWFVDHAPQPHLDGGYTVFGKVNETGMKVVDRIVKGDTIISVRIVGR